RPVIAADEQMHHLVLDQAVADVGAVMRSQRELQLAIDAEFLAQPPPRRRRDRLAGARMRAAGVGPQAAGVIFAERPLLQQHAPARIKDADRNRAMSEAPRMGVDLRREADLAVLLIDQNDSLVAVDHGRHAENERSAEL